MVLTMHDIQYSAKIYKQGRNTQSYNMTYFFLVINTRVHIYILIILDDNTIHSWVQKLTHKSVS